MLTTGQAGPATTTWNYQDTTGWLSGKLYPGGDSISYTQTAAGRLLTRNTGRAVTRTYSYDLGGRPTGMDYSDSTPDVIFTLNRLGQVTDISDGVGTRTRSITTDGRILSESYTSGLLSGASATYGYDALLRRETFSTNTGGPDFDVTYGYDGASRLSTVTSGADATTYTYAANSRLITGLETVRSGTPRLITTTSYDNLERLTSISSSTSGTVVSAHAYTFDGLNRRTESILEDDNKWHYQYDSMGQVVTGEKKHSSGVSIPGMKFGYAFDGIGNRNSATINGRTGSYTADLANQYTERQIPGALEIRGRASTTARVTINTQSTERLNEYFYKALTIDNSSAPQYPGVSILAVKNHVGPNDEDLQSETTGHLYIAKNPEIFTHDAEGNLTTDGRWAYTWDGENRLIRQETIATVPTAAKRKLEFAYDAESRRIRKQVSNWNDTTWVLQKDLRFLYDGWNLVAELDAANTMQRNFVWGLDLSRTPQGAGGVGGLLAIREGTESHLPAYDGNGNIMALVKASDESTSARYEYGPFGETLVVEETGISNPFRFSTKYLDSETGLYYYGYRYYDPITGRWPSRDPIEERGGANLYGFVDNGGINHVDVIGRSIEIYMVDTNSIPLNVGAVGGNAWAETDVRKWTFSGSSNLTLAAWFSVGTTEVVELSGSLEIPITIAANINENYNPNYPSGFTIAEHERYHAWLCKDAFNTAAKKANAFEGKYCSGCGDKAKRFALAIMTLAKNEQIIANKNFDRLEYGGGHVSQTDVIALENAKKELDAAEKDYKKSKCKKL